MHQALQGASFHIEHIIPESHGGVSLLDNLAFACPSCNLHKSDRVHAVDPDSGTDVPLFNPRKDTWGEHFQWSGHLLLGKTRIGRATVSLLQCNHPRRLLIRQAEQSFGLFPP